MSTSCSCFATLAPHRLAFSGVPRRWARFLLFLGAVLTVAETFTVTPPTGYESNQNEVDTSEAAMPEAAWRGYPRLFTEKTSSLLNEAVHMLHRAKDIQERRWLQTFIQRLAQLASDLERSTLQYRSFPVVLSGPQSLQHQPHQQQTAPTTGQISPPPSPPSLGHLVPTTTQGSAQEEVRGLGKPEVVTQPNFVGDESASSTRQLLEERPRPRSPSLEERGSGRYTTETYSLESVGPASLKPTTPLSGRDVSFFFEKIQSLIGLGMSEKDEGEGFQKRTRSRADSADPKEDGAKAPTRPTLGPAEAPTPLITVPGMNGSPRGADASSVAGEDLVRQLERGRFLPG